MRFYEAYNGWNVKHFYSFYVREHEGSRSYTWVKNELQKGGLVKRARGKGKHRVYLQDRYMHEMKQIQTGQVYLLLTVPSFVGIGQGAATYLRPNTHVVKLAALGA